MTAEPESTQSAAPATFKRTELQRFPSPIPGWEIVQTLVEIPEGLDSGRHSHPGGPEVGFIV
jgi:quercetin dioxygenase-like cupin family protein